MLTVVVGLVSAVVFGTADFFGGLASKRLGSLLATPVAAVSGLVLYLVVECFVGGRLSAEAIGWGAVSGVFGAVAIGLLYACLAIGPMSILSPLTAVVSAIVPLVWALVGGETVGWIGWVGLGLGLVAIVFVAFVREREAARLTPRALLMALGSGVSIGAFLIVIDLAPDDSGLWPMIMNRSTNAAVMLLVLAGVATVRRASSRSARAATAGVPVAVRSGSDWRRGLWLATVCGLIDATANAGLLLGVRIGDLSVMAVLTALYPIGTIVLARLVLKERIAPLQVLGLILAITASVLLALA